MSDHQHCWKMVMHVDYCHYYLSSYSCSCGAILSTNDERDPTFDPYSLIWMDPEETGTDCKRCDEIRVGGKVKNSVTLTLPNGTIEKDETFEREQETP